MNDLQTIIEEAFDNRANISPAAVDPDIKQAIDQAINLIDSGEARVAEQHGVGNWHVNEWLKKAVLLSFRVQDNAPMSAGGFTQFYDKVETKLRRHQHHIRRNIRPFPRDGGRNNADTGLCKVLGSIAPNVVLMPSYVNIGAYVDSGAMVDTWATVGSCAQIGKNVHLSGGVGIGGVLEPLQAAPTIIEDNCFIGARSEIVEGIIVEEGAVISMGVYIGQSTKILDRETGEIMYGRVPAGSVVVSGSLPAEDKSHSLYCAVIVKKVDEKTRGKVGINELLRNI